MIIPDRTYTENPFIDNVIYHAKYLALNCTIKDEERAVLNETTNTLRDGNILISCIESTSTYETFRFIPEEILAKYIPSSNNIDLYVNDPDALRLHLSHYNIYDRVNIYERLSDFARRVYIDHYDIMMNYIEYIGSSWLDDNEQLYNACKNNTATYIDLFDVLPAYTRRRILNQYLSDYNDEINVSLNALQEYISARDDNQINTEIDYINNAMRSVFASHYDIMKERKYLKASADKWLDYNYLIKTNSYSLTVKSTYDKLYEYFPKDELEDTLITCIGLGDVNTYGLAVSLDNLENYLDTICINPDEIRESITNNMWVKYLAGNNLYLSHEIYESCINGEMDYFDLLEYLPKETQKMILSSEFKMISNLEVYEADKEILDNYLDTLPQETREEIKNSINEDMRKWYPDNHKEDNNYYRALIGLPPIGDDGEPYEDTLIHSYDPTTNSYIEFGNKFIDKLYEDDNASRYPVSHWTQDIYKFDPYDISVLNNNGILEEYVTACKSTLSSDRYRYIKYIIDGKLDLYQCRKAYKFQLIGIPPIDDADIKKRFIDCYEVNKDYCIRVVYSDAHKFQSEYYDKFMIIFILINTIIDMLSTVNEMIINREIFDNRCIKWLFESCGAPYYSEIPLKYLKAMLKNLNVLFKYKSSTKNMIDICKLFGFSDIRVFNYYLFKERSKDENGEYIPEENNDISYDLDILWVRDPNGETTDYNGISYTKLTEYYKFIDNEDYYTKEIKYEEDGGVKTKRIIKNDAPVYIKDPNAEYNDFIPLQDTAYFKNKDVNTNPSIIKFIKVPIDESLTDYKNDSNYIVTYDELVEADEGNTWDGGNNHNSLYQEFVDYEFNADKSKYVSVETVTDLTEQTFQVSYFYNMLFDNLYSEDALTLEIPYIKSGHTFRFTDIICYLFALMYFYNGIEDNIMYSPTQILYVKGYNFNEALNKILQDSTIFSGDTNIFDINEKIESENYDYQEAFKDYNIKCFNLEADIDALEQELNEKYGITLDDFVVDDTLTDFNQIITIRQFFSLNNSYYQKDIFKNNAIPLAYNENIKYSYKLSLLNKKHGYDYNKYEYCYVVDDGNLMEIINNTDESIYVLYHKAHVISTNGTEYSIFKKYKYQDGNYIRANSQYYFYNTASDLFELVPDGMEYKENNDYYNITHLLILQENNEYELYELSEDSYIKIDSNNKKYLYNSDEEYITVIYSEPVYRDTKSLAVIFNKQITRDTDDEDIIQYSESYNAEETDNVWDENDWFYEDPDGSETIEEIGMRGENIWYYKDPNSINDNNSSKEPSVEKITAGFYIESSSYIGNITLDEGQKYYMSFDIETNFNTQLQIYNTSDRSVVSTENRLYDIVKGTKTHIFQTFIANNSASSNIMVLMHDFDQYSINIGDYIVISNINIMKAYSENFIPRDIPSYDKIKELYKTNEKIYKYINELMNKESDYNTYNIYKKIYDALMISKYNKEAFKIGDREYAKTYTDFLATRDTVLSNNLERFKSMDIDTMRKQIADEIIEIVYAVDQCVDTYSYGFLYSYFPAVSANYIQQYITKIINWFKSWKVHLLGINTVYRFGDSSNNDAVIKILERKQYKNRVNNIKGNVYVYDGVKINPIDDTNISGVKYSDLYNLDNICSTTYPDNIITKDRIRIISHTGNYIEYRDSATQLHFVFNDNEIVAKSDDNNLRITSNNAGFRTANQNDIIMESDEDEQKPMINQIINEINIYTGDYIDWSGMLDE